MEIVGITETRQDDGDGRGDVPEAVGSGQAGETRCLLRGVTRKRWSAVRCCEAGSIRASNFEASLYVLSKEEVGSYAVLQGLPAAVLLRTTDVTAW
jgi:translation elongation factor EF-Tu-like GTPase